MFILKYSKFKILELILEYSEHVYIIIIQCIVLAYLWLQRQLHRFISFESHFTI